MTEIFKENRRLLYRTLWKLGGKELVEELNNKECEWWGGFSVAKHDRRGVLINAFDWRESKQKYSFWSEINKRIQNN